MLRKHTIFLERGGSALEEIEAGDELVLIVGFVGRRGERGEKGKEEDRGVHVQTSDGDDKERGEEDS